MGAIYKRELKAYFTGMMGYVFIAFILLMFGIYTTAYHLNYGYPNFEVTISSTSFLFLIAVPIPSWIPPTSNCIPSPSRQPIF